MFDQIFNTVPVVAMSASLVLHRVLHQLLCDRTSQSQLGTGHYKVIEAVVLVQNKSGLRHGSQRIVDQTKIATVYCMTFVH